MKIDSIELNVNGCELSLKNIDGNQLVNVINALNISVDGSEEKKAKRTRMDKENYQYDNYAHPLPENFSKDKAYNHKIIWESKDTGRRLKSNSKQVLAKQSIMGIVIGEGNKPMLLDEIIERMSYTSSCSGNGVRTYTSTLLRDGVLSKHEVSGKLFISKWFIDQVSK